MVRELFYLRVAVKVEVPTEIPPKKGAPSGFTVPIRGVRLAMGAEFVVVMTGDIMTMPGLPRVPAAEAIGLDDDANIVGLF